MSIHPSAVIHRTAIVEDGATIGEQTRIGPWAYIDQEVTIGAHCVIGPRVTILRYTKLGSHCEVHNGAVLGDTPQDVAFKNQPSYVQIGNHCIIREFVTIHRGTKPDTITQVGDHCFLMADAHLGHNAQLGNHVIMANASMLGGYVSVGDRAFISGNVAVHQFVRVGKMAMVSGLSGFSKDIPPFCMAAFRNSVWGLNMVGLRRAGLSSADRESLREAFRILFRSDLDRKASLEKIRQDFTNPYVLELLQFITESKRGICRYAVREGKQVEEDA